MPAIRVFASPAAYDQLQRGTAGTMPATAAIVNEKLNDDDPEAKGYAYAAMIKREEGYDPAHGDWEYVYGEYGEGGQVRRGRLQSCIECHSKVAAQDYLFRT